MKYMTPSDWIPQLSAYEFEEQYKHIKDFQQRQKEIRLEKELYELRKDIAEIKGMLSAKENG